MAKQMNWRRFHKASALKNGKQYEFEQQWKMNRRYSAYRDGEFWIGDRKIEKWNPDRQSYPGTEGIFFNKKLGVFEAWKEAKKIGSIPWKRPWQELVWWAHKYDPNSF